MLMIVCLHYFGKGGLLGKPSDPELTAAGYTIWFLEALCLSAVNLYVLISGYFGGGTYSLQRPFRIWKQVFFYIEQYPFPNTVGIVWIKEATHAGWLLFHAFCCKCMEFWPGKKIDIA